MPEPSKYEGLGQRWFDRCMADFDFFRAREAWILSKEFQEEKGERDFDEMMSSGMLIRFDPLWPNQQRCVDAFWKQWNEKGRVWLDVFKTRRTGSSTLWALLATWMCLKKPYFRAGIASLDADSTNELFDIPKNVLRNLTFEVTDPSGGRHRIPWPVNPGGKGIRDNDDWITINNRSKIRVATAGKGGSGQGGKELFRGPTLHYLVLSEMAHWASAEETELGCTSTMSKRHSIIIRESTSNGRTGTGRYWYDLYEQHVRGESAADYIFLDVFGDPTNYDQPNDEMVYLFEQYKELYAAGDVQAERYAQQLHRHFRFTEYERRIVHELNVNPGQLLWYHNLLRSMSGSEEARLVKRAQEFPAFIEESFRFEGATTFDQVALSLMLNHRKVCIRGALDFDRVVAANEYATSEHPDVMVPPMVATAFGMSASADGPQRIMEQEAANRLKEKFGDYAKMYEHPDGSIHALTFTPLDQGLYEIYEEPVVGATYRAGIDTARGMRHDSTDCRIMRLQGGVYTEVAGWCSSEHDPITAAWHIYLLMRYYNNGSEDPLCVPEMNDVGDTVFRELWRLGYRNFYVRKVDANLNGGISTKYGWWTGHNRSGMVAHGKKLLAEKRLVLNGERTIQHWMGMRRNETTGKDDHARLEFNDAWTSVTIATMADTLRPEDIAREVRAAELTRPARDPKQADIERTRLEQGDFDETYGSGFGNW